MRPSNKQRSRNKQGNGGHSNNNNNNNNNNNQRQRMGNIINRVFESAGPDGKVRGTPQQIIDKYQALARDAQVAGDRVAAESFLQHSEHYSRLLGEAQRHQLEQREREEGARQDRPQSQDQGFRPQSSGAQQGGFGFGGIDADDEPSTGLIDTPEGRAEQTPRSSERGVEPMADIPSRTAEPEPARDPAPVVVAEPSWQSGSDLGPEAGLPEPTLAPEPERAESAPPAPDASVEEQAAAPRPRRPRRRKTEAAQPAADETAAVVE